MVTAIIGTELKFNLYIAPISDIHAADYDFTVKVSSNSKSSVIIPKDDCIMQDDDNFLVMVDTTALGVGPISFEVIAQVPDGDFDDGFRTEIARYKTDVQIAL